MIDPYIELGVNYNATDEEIRKRYLALTREFPPEQHPKRFASFRAAYEKIKDLDARADYALFDTDTSQLLEAIIEEQECQNSQRRITLQSLITALK